MGSISGREEQSFTPHRSATHMFPLPSPAGYTAPVGPKARPGGASAQLESATYGFGAWFCA